MLKIQKFKNMGHPNINVYILNEYSDNFNLLLDSV